MTENDRLLARLDAARDAGEREAAVRAVASHARMLNQSGRSEEALPLYAEVLARARDGLARGEPWARGRELYALYASGLALRRLGRADEALEAFSRLRESVLDGGPVPDDSLLVVVNGLLLRGAILRDRGDLDGAVAAYAEVLDRYGDTDLAREKEAPAHLGYALQMQAFARAEAGDREGSAAASRFGIERLRAFDADDKTAIHRAGSFYNLGFQAERLGEPDGALAAWAELIARYGDRDASELRRQVARGLNGTAELLWRFDRLDESLAIGDEVERRYDAGARDDDVAEVRALVADAARRRAAILLRRGRADEVVDLARELLVRFGDDPDEEVRAAARNVRFELGIALMERGSQDEAVVVLEAFLADPGLEQSVERIVRARMARALALHQGGRPAEAAEEYDRLLAEPGLADEPRLRSVRVTALMNAADALSRAGDDEATFAAHRRFVATVADDVAGAFDAVRAEVVQRDPDAPLLRNQRALLDLKEAATLHELERREEAVRALHALIARWEDDDLPDVAGAVAMARELLAELEG